MIYFDNAATTMKKPQQVYDNLLGSVNKLGNNGRGFNRASLDTSRYILDTRIKLAKLFNAPSPKDIAFTANATESLNIAINGLFRKGDHVITTVAEHNSVLRPLYRLEDAGVIDISFLDIIKGDEVDNRKGILDIDSLESFICSNTKALIITHASNVTGNITDLKKVSEICKKHNLIMIVDAAQSAGVIDIDIESMGIDILCFTGHKGLFGIQGTGGIYVRDGIDIDPLKVGGSGVKSFDRIHPTTMPERLEAGTLNGHGIVALNGGVSFILEEGLDKLKAKEDELKKYFVDQLREIPDIIYYGNPDLNQRVGIVSINIAGIDSSKAADLLASKYDIAIRAGAHCAPLMHKALDTDHQGLLRFSLSYFNTKEEIDEAIRAIDEISKEYK